MNVLIILGHPRVESLCGALAGAYEQGAQQAGVAIKRLNLATLAFDPYVRVESPEQQPLEPDLAGALELIEWADHLVFVYPTWWGTMPALMKGFLDRIVMPGRAFRFYGPGATDWEGLWAGKSAQLITTMDTPPVIYRHLFRSPGNHAMAEATLGFCGVSPVRKLVCGSVRTSDMKRRRDWLEQARRAGYALIAGVRSPTARAARGGLTWLRALRLQFYPMTWAAYTVGALAAAANGVNLQTYLWGYLFLFALEAATVFCNDYVDYPSDRVNQHFGPFTGGSRVLVDGSTTFAGIRHAIAIALAGTFVAGAMMLRLAPAPGTPLAWCPVALVLTLGYTMPPLRLSYRGLGEIDVGITHSILVMFLGYVLQGGAGTDALPWLISAPLALAILPAIMLAGLPDREADASAGKRTLAVRLGPRLLIVLAAAAIVAATSLAVAFDRTGIGGGVFNGLTYFAVPHAAACLLLLNALWQRMENNGGTVERINGTLFVTLNFMVWFVAVPFYHLW